MIFSEHGWLALSGVSLVLALAFPSFIANILINIIVKRKKVNRLIQLSASVVVICVYYEYFGIFGMPFINDIQNFLINHNGNTIDTTVIDTNRFTYP